MTIFSGGLLFQQPGCMVGFGSLTDRQHDRRAFGQRQKPLRESQGCRIRPMQIVEGADDRSIGGNTLEELDKDLEGTELQGFGRQRFEQGRGVGLEVEAQYRREVWISLSATPRERFLRLPAQSHAQSKLWLRGADLQPVSKEVAVRPV